MEIKIEKDAYDEGKCLLMQRDCISGYFCWKQYKEGKDVCPCELCELFLGFKNSKMTLTDFRRHLRDVGSYALIDSFCEDMQVKFVNQG